MEPMGKPRQDTEPKGVLLVEPGLIGRVIQQCSLSESYNEIGSNESSRTGFSCGSIQNQRATAIKLLRAPRATA